MAAWQDPSGTSLPPVSAPAAARHEQLQAVQRRRGQQAAQVTEQADLAKRWSRLIAEAAGQGAGHRDRAGRDDPGFGFDHDVGLEPLLAPAGGLVRVPGLRVHRADHPVRGDPLRDPPPPRAVRVVDDLDGLTGDQPEQPDRGGDRGQHGVGVADQTVGQLLAGRGVVPGDLPLSRPGVVMPRPGGHGEHKLLAARHCAGDPADRRDQLRDRILGGHRLVQHGWSPTPAGSSRATPP